MLKPQQLKYLVYSSVFYFSGIKVCCELVMHHACMYNRLVLPFSSVNLSVISLQVVKDDVYCDISGPTLARDSNVFEV